MTDYPLRDLSDIGEPYETFVAERRAGEPSGFRHLRVWELSFELAAECHRFTSSLPPDEKFELGSQIRRSAASIPANIAEGWGRHSDGDFERSVQIALGSLRELETHLLLCRELELAPQEAIEDLVIRTEPLGGMLFRLREAIRARRAAASSRSRRSQDATH